MRILFSGGGGQATAHSTDCPGHRSIALWARPQSARARWWPGARLSLGGRLTGWGADGVIDLLAEEEGQEEREREREIEGVTEENASPASTAEAAWGGEGDIVLLLPSSLAQSRRDPNLEAEAPNKREGEKNARRRISASSHFCLFGGGGQLWRLPVSLPEWTGRFARPASSLSSSSSSSILREWSRSAWCLLYEGLGIMSTQMRKDVDM